MELVFLLERVLWSGPLLVLLMGTHLYMTVKLRGVQRHTLRGIRLSLRREPGESGISAFGALATSLAAAIGTGNIIGVATAIILGGPGAVFWCWFTGLFGMATRYGETVLCLLHRRKGQGGAMYVLEDVLHRRGMAAAFAVFGVAAATGTGAMIQSNAMAAAMKSTCGMPVWITGLVVTVLAGAIILGGIRSVAGACERLVPAMSALYLLGCLTVLVRCRSCILPALGEILSGALSPRAAGGGFAGGTILTAARYGTARGLFTNESGMGTAPLAASAGPGRNPKEEALVSMTGVFWDTVVICAMTGVTLVAAMLKFPALFQNAGPETLCFLGFSCIPGGKWVLTASLMTFAFSTVVGWCYYGECCSRYLWGPRADRPYRGAYLICTLLGAFLKLELLWSLGAILAGLMALPNLYMLWRLRDQAAETLGKQLLSRENPV